MRVLKPYLLTEQVSSPTNPSQQEQISSPPKSLHLVRMFLIENQNLGVYFKSQTYTSPPEMQLIFAIFLGLLSLASVGSAMPIKVVPPHISPIPASAGIALAK
jgi:hypothetical protein